jgi:predicted nucleic acid-binding protein
LIALETSSMIAYLSGEPGVDVEAIDLAMQLKESTFPPVVVMELLSDHTLPQETVDFVRQIPQLDILAGYWERAGELRARLRRRGFKAHVADTLIAQCCLDHDVTLITRDRDFRHFVRFAGLRLGKPLC